jgi:hypothetical protein
MYKVAWIFTSHFHAFIFHMQIILLENFTQVLRLIQA